MQEQLNRARTLVQQNGVLISILGTESIQGKLDIVTAINKMGGDASIDDTLSTLAAKIANLSIIETRLVLKDTVKKPISILDVKSSDIIECYCGGDSLPYSLKNCTDIKKIEAPNLLTLNVEQLRNIGVEYIKLPSLRNWSGTAQMASLELCVTIELPVITSLTHYLFEGDYKLENLYIPKVDTLAINCFNKCTSLIRIELGKEFSANINFSSAGFNPTVAYSKTSSSLVEEGESFNNNNEKWNHNLREYFAANLQDRTGYDTIYTITFGSTVLAQMEEATIKAFTDKNWTLA